MKKDSATQEDFAQLMAELAEGSEEAAWRIANVYTPHILRAVRASLPSSIRSKLDSQDLAQIIWTSLLVKREHFPGVKSPQELVNLLVRISRNKVVDAYRHYSASQIRDHRRESPLDAIDNPKVFDRELTPSQAVSTREAWQAILTQLSPRDAKILRLRIDQKPYQEIAEATGVSITTVRQVLNRIVSQIRDEK